MLTNTKTKAFDGDYQIIFSDTFNIYENRLVLTDIAGYTFEFVFEKEIFVKSESKILLNADEEKKKVTITLKSFRNQLGVGTTNKMPIINLKDKRTIFFSIHSKSLSKETDFLQVVINFYLK